MDRVHTGFHGDLRAVCDEATTAYERDEFLVALFKKLRAGHPKFQDLGSRAQDIERLLNGLDAKLS